MLPQLKNIYIDLSFLHFHMRTFFGDVFILQVALRGGKPNLKVFWEKQILKNNADPLSLSLQQIPPWHG